jgi:hypothetical protein
MGFLKTLHGVRWKSGPGIFGNKGVSVLVGEAADESQDGESDQESGEIFPTVIHELSPSGEGMDNMLVVFCSGCYMRETIDATPINATIPASNRKRGLADMNNIVPFLFFRRVVSGGTPI